MHRSVPIKLDLTSVRARHGPFIKCKPPVPKIARTLLKNNQNYYDKITPIENNKLLRYELKGTGHWYGTIV